MASNLRYLRFIPVYSSMFLLMCGVMLTLVAWSVWFTSRLAQIEEPLFSYDYIVVGGGSAGCVLAARLSENSNRTVLLVEAGKQFNWISSIPLASPILQGSENDWAYVTRPQTHSSYGLLNQISSWPRGRGLGGSAQMNYLLHFPGAESDFLSWKQNGVKGWGTDDIHPYMADILGHDNFEHAGCSNSYKEFLTNVGPNICRQRKARLRLVRNAESALGSAFLDAGKELGVNLAYAENTVYEGKRWTALDGFLRPVLQRRNLHVLLESHVDKIFWDKTKTRALGIELKRTNRPVQQIQASREIILSAGAIGTPQILMRSGVGPKRLLKELKIPVVADLPVGLNLHDHMNFPLYVSLTSPVSTTIRKLLHPSHVWNYVVHGRGLLSTSGVVGVGNAPDNVGLVLFGMGSTDETLLRAIANYKPKTFRALFPFSGNWSQEGAVFLASCLQPESRGRVFLTDSQPSSKPSIDPRYLTRAGDVTCMINALKLAIQVSSTTAFKKLGAKVHLPNFEECDYLASRDHDLSYLECVIRTAAITGYHPGGTCKMGESSDRTSVVDSSLRVHGLRGVRVGDASIFPTPISGHPNSVLLAMASKASQMILYS